MRSLEDILNDINQFKPVDDNWLKLDTLLEELWNTGQPEKGIVNLFRVFERFPLSTGEGVFWSILHGLEELDYEKELLASLQRVPSEMGLTMLQRISNADIMK